MKRRLADWTKHLGLIAALTSALLFSGCGGPDEPGEAEFEAVNGQITTNAKGAAHGDSPEAQAAAGKFAASIKQMQGLFFSGGSGKSLASGGDFVTVVAQRPGAVIVLCHVPELRNYKTKEVRESLAELAWTVAQSTMAKLPGVSPETKLIVGLRGFASYGPIWEGKIEGDAQEKSDDVGGRKRFYPHFATSEPVAAKPKDGA